MHSESQDVASGPRGLVAAAIDDAPLSVFQVRSIALCGAVALLDGFDGQAIAFAGPTLIKSWHLSPGEFGWLVSLGLIGALLGALLQGPVADRIGRRPLILAATFLFGVGTLACSLADDAWTLGLLRFVSGLGLGAAIVNIVALTGELSPARVRSTLIAAMTSGLALGAFLGGVLASQLIETMGWRSVFVAGGLGPLLLGAFLMLYLPESPQLLATRGRPSDMERLKALLARIGASIPDLRPGSEPSAVGIATQAEAFHSSGRMAGSLALIGIFFLNQMVMFFLFSWMPAVLAGLGLPVGRAVLISSLLSLGSVAGGICLSATADRGARRLILPVGYALGALACTLLGMAGTGMAALASLSFAAGFFVGGSQLVAYGIAVAFFPTPVRARGLGILVTASRAGAIVGPLAGAAFQAFAFKGQSLFISLAGPLMLAAAASLIIGKKRRTSIGGLSSRS